MNKGITKAMMLSNSGKRKKTIRIMAATMTAWIATTVAAIITGWAAIAAVTMMTAWAVAMAEGNMMTMI